MADESEKVVRLVPPIMGDGFKADHAEMLDAAKEHQFTSLTIVGILPNGYVYCATSNTMAQMMLDIERAKHAALIAVYGED